MITDHWMGLGACDCPEAQLARRLAEALDPGDMLDRLASTLAVWKLRQMSHDLSAAGDWSASHLPYARRLEYDTDARTAPALHADVAASWQDFYEHQTTEWLTAALEHATPDGPHGTVVRKILRERQ